MPVAGDVPGTYDVVINAEGYLFVDDEEVKAQYGYTPTFVPRTNTQGDYGDNQQDFWLSVGQKDWVLGEQQRFYRNDEDRSRRYWKSFALDRTEEGALRLHYELDLINATDGLSESIQAITHYNVGNYIALGGTANLWVYSTGAGITSLGAHGLGGIPSRHGMAFDGANIFFGRGSGGGIRRYNYAGTAFSTFSATGADSLCYMNNTLYGFDNTNNRLLRYDTAGVATVVHTFQDATGGVSGITGKVGTLCAYGGKLLIMRGYSENSYGGGDLWAYDGTGVARLAEFPPNFFTTFGDICVAYGIVFIGGAMGRKYAGFDLYRGAILYYSNGNLNLLWEDKLDYANSAANVAVTPFSTGVAFTDANNLELKWYDIIRGGVHTIGTASGMDGAERIFASGGNLFITSNSAVGYGYPYSVVQSTGYIQTSLMDFDSSLPKVFRGIKVEFDDATNGDGGSVDIAYRVGDVSGAYTTLQTDVASGTEYTLSGITGRSISIKVTLNRGTSSLGPVLKRISVRAVPQQTTFRKEKFVIACRGRDAANLMVVRNGTIHGKDGLTMAQDLRTAVASTTPISITDEFGTFTGVIETEGFELRRIATNEFIAIVPVREV